MKTFATPLSRNSRKKTDLTGSCQHVSKKNFGTEIACLEIQTKLSNACDNRDYAALATLDLTAAFDVVDRKLLNCIVLY